MYILWTTLYLALSIVWLFLLLRIVYDLVSSFVRGWRPRGINLIIASAVFSVTDPPLRALRSKIPPLNLGGIGIDVAFLIAFFVVIILQSITLQLALSTSSMY